MRLTVLLLTVALLNVQASGLSQTVTFSGKDIPLRTVFSVIKEQTGFVVFGNVSLFNNTRPVTVSAEKMPLVSFLNLVLNNQPLSYTIDGKTIFIAAQPQAVKPAIQPAPDKISFDLFPDQGMEIWGMVRNLRNEPLGGASVTIKRTKKGTTTGSNGYFNLKGVEIGDTIITSFIGYKTSYTRVGQELPVNVYLQLAESQLDQVVIQGYGTTTMRTGTGAITKISGEELSKANSMNPVMALQGRVPGLLITPADGQVSGRFKVEVRGRKSLSRDFSGDPLVIIDGVPMTILELNPGGGFENGSQGVSQGISTNPAQGQNAFFGLNPADIESIEILRDADATAIYGSRGANGVILITSKRGKNKGGALFNMNVNTGVTMVTKHWDMLSTPEYLRIRRQAFANDGITPTKLTAPDLMVWDTTRYTDWQKELWGNWGKASFVDASLNGGNENTTYRLSGAFNRVTDMSLRPGRNDAYNIGFALGHTSLDRKFKLDFVGAYIRTEVMLRPNSSPTLLAPNAPPIYTAEGTYNFKEYNDAGLYDSYPFGTLENKYSSGNNRLNLSLKLAYEFLKDLKGSVNIGYGNSDGNNTSIIPIAGQNVEYYGSAVFGTSTMSSTNIRNWIIEPQLDYAIRFGSGRLDLTTGTTYQNNRTAAVSNVGMLYNNDAFLESLNLAPYLLGQSLKAQYKYAGVFGRIRFNWDDKYMFNLNARRDGSSRFGTKNQFGNFGSLGAAWQATKEDWARKLLPDFISLVKPRLTYGITGSDEIGDYKYLTQWSGTMPANGGVSFTPLYSYDGLNPLVSQLHVNPNYHWQTNKKLDLGITLGLLNDRITFDYTRYWERVEDQLTDYPVPYLTGFPVVLANFPAILTNKGHEFNLRGQVINKKDLRVDVNFNLTINRNRLESYPDFEHSPYIAYYTVGRSVNAVYLLHYLGVDPQTGKYSFEDHDKSGVVNVNGSKVMMAGYDDRYIALDLSPKYYGGFGISVAYKNWNLYSQFSYIRKYTRNIMYPQDPIGRMVNMPRDVVGNYWEKPGDVKRFAAPTTLTTTSMAFFNVSDGNYVDMKMLRCSSINLGYDMPVTWMNKIRLRSGSVFLRASNLFFISNIGGLDPEVSSVGALPMARTVTAGFNISL